MRTIGKLCCSNVSEREPPGGAPRILEKTSRGGIEMAYPKERIDEVLAYLDEGHSARDAVLLLKLLIFSCPRC